MKRYTILLAAIAITACIIFVTINIINQDTIQVIDYSSDYTSMPKGFDSLPEYNEDNDKEHISIVLPESKCAATIYVINPEMCIGLTGNKGLTDNEILLLTSLQGIIAQERAEIYIGKTSDKWIKYVSKEYGLTLEKKNDLKELITNYKDKINGYVKAEWKTNNTYNKQINQASTLSGIENLLIAAVRDNDKGKEMTDIIESLGIECIYDLNAMEKTEYDIINENLSSLNKDIIILQEPSKTEYLRDFGIATKSPFYFYDMNTEDDITESLLFKFNPLAIAFGWEEVTVNNKLIGEIEDLTVERLSKHNMGLVPADFCENLSLWYSLPREKFYQGEKNKYSTDDANGEYHYATLVYSDGDNIQCWQGGPFDTERFAYPNKEELAIGWTATPILLETMPMVLKYLYQKATGNEEFVCSISGYNFSKPSEFNKNAMQAYVKKTARLMKDADMKLLALKDEADEILHVWDEFSKYENVEGGFFMYGKYQENAGNIYWANDKPLIFEREILWDREDRNQAMEENPARVAVKLNHFVKDRTRAEGYTFIQVHSWSYTYSDLYNVFYQNLDLSQVKVVTPGEFVSMIRENVPHTNGEKVINTDHIDVSGHGFAEFNGYFMQEAYPRWNRMDDDNGDIEYIGNWVFSNTDQGLNGTSHTSGTKNDAVKIKFTGTDFKLFVNTRRSGGYFSVYVDGKLMETRFSCFGRAPEGFCEVVSVGGLKEGKHTVRIKVLGDKETISAGTDVVVDGFYYK